MKPILPDSKMNDIETEFYWIQYDRKRQGEIEDFWFEPMTFNLAPKTTFKPDFFIVHKDHFEFAEIKARGKIKEGISKKTGKPYKKQWTSKRDDAVVKIKVSAAKYPHFEWNFYYHEADGRWTKEAV